MVKYTIEETTLSAIGDAIREKTGKTDLIAPRAMPAEIASITTGGGELPEEAFNITGSGKYRFSYDGWNWFVDNYGNRITTTDLTNGSYMFSTSTKLTKIPFILNFKTTYSVECAGIFMDCYELLEVPKINNCNPTNLDDMFNGCHSLRYLPENIDEWFNWTYTDNASSSSVRHGGRCFKNCYSLRSVPMDFLNHENPKITLYVYHFYNELFYGCYALDEIISLPIPHANALTWTSNFFRNTFGTCCRIKDFTFATNEDGTPITVNWKSQTIDLSGTLGYAPHYNYIISYNSGITEDKEVTDDTTYQALKDNPDWFTVNVAYSRYNHDSAVATINSLPDTSAYLATAGGTNTIKFKGASGSKTDGGAINTLTEEEIAVATAKGWTVTLV